MEANQIDIFASAVLGNLEQIDDAEETRLAREPWSDIRETDQLDRIHLDLTFFHSVTGTHFHVGTCPYADATSDFSTANALAKSLGEHHEESLHAAAARWERVWLAYPDLGCLQQPKPGMPGKARVYRPLDSGLKAQCGFSALGFLILKSFGL